MKRYHQRSPPEFPIPSIRVPLALYYGTTDKFVVQEDIEKGLLPMLRDAVWAHPPVKIPRWNHADFVFSKTAVFYADMVAVCRKHAAVLA